MSKLKVAKAVKKSFGIIGAVLKWSGISALIILALYLLVQWALAHFLSFAIVIGTILAFFAIGCIICLLDWSDKVIKEAQDEEAVEQARERAERLRQERTVPDFGNDFLIQSDPYDKYR